MISAFGIDHGDISKALSPGCKGGCDHLVHVAHAARKGQDFTLHARTAVKAGHSMDSISNAAEAGYAARLPARTNKKFKWEH